jgi:hypothetical protein
VESQDIKGLGAEVAETSSCQHVWVIDTPNGPSSRGVCAACAEEKEFQNYIEGSAWGYDVSVESLSGGSRFPSGRSPVTKGLAEDGNSE